MKCYVHYVDSPEELNLDWENYTLTTGQRVCSSAILAQSSLLYQDNSGYFKPFAPSPPLTAHLFVKIAGSEACKKTGWRCTVYIERARKAPIHARPRPSPWRRGHGLHVTLLDLGMARVKGGRVLIKDSRERSASTGVAEERVWKRREGERDDEQQDSTRVGWVRTDAGGS